MRTFREFLEARQLKDKSPRVRDNIKPKKPEIPLYGRAKVIRKSSQVGSFGAVSIDG